MLQARKSIHRGMRFATGGRQPASASGFTLVELLVVVSIIALLISILLPSLKSARDQAKTVKCQANVKGLGTAAATYQTEYNEWIPGSPGTTGSALLGRYGGQPADKVDIPEPPVQVWDYAGPLAVEAMHQTSIPANRAERFRYLSKGIFECAANQLTAVPYPSQSQGSPFIPQRQISYQTLRNFLYWARSSAAPFGEADWPFDVASLGNTLIPGSGTPPTPGDYRPRVDRVGAPAEKVFLADGSRFTTDDGKLDFDINWNAGYGGAFSDGGPTLNDMPTNYMRSFRRRDPERRYTYRHGKVTAPGLVAVFFDGHGAYMSEKTSRFPDPWWPKDTRIPRTEFNRDSLLSVQGMLTGTNYIVRR